MSSKLNPLLSFLHVNVWVGPHLGLAPGSDTFSGFCITL